MNNNIEKAPIYEYYITRPMTAAARSIANFFVAMHRDINKSWYCEECKKYHSGRVYRYCNGYGYEGVCFKHIDISKLYTYTVYLGGKRCTGAVLTRIYEKYNAKIDDADKGTSNDEV